MFQQPGIYDITLYERKSLAFEYPSIGEPTTINNLTSGGQTITIGNDQRPVLEVTPKISTNRKVIYEYSLSFLKENFNLTSLSLLRQLKETIYGWMPILTMYEGSQRFIDVAFFFDSAEHDSNDSNSFEIEMVTNVDSKARLFYVVEDSEGNKLLINDTDYLLINDTNHLLIS